MAALTDADKQSIVRPIRDGLVEVVTGSPGLFLDRPGFIAGGGPSDPFSDVIRGISQLNCRQWAANDKSNYSIRVNEGNSRLCGPYLDGLGELPPEGGIEQDTVPGQCSGVTYRVVATGNARFATCFDGTVFNTNALSPQDFTVTGPITLAGYFAEGDNGPCGPRQYRFKMQGPNFSNINVLVSSTGGSNKANPPTQTVTITRPDGLPDDCGDLPPEYLPPGVSTPGTPPPPNITVNVPGIGPVTVGVDQDDDGDVVVCVEEIDTCFTVDIGGDNPPPTPPPNPTIPGDQGEPGTPSDTGEAGDAEGDAPSGEVLVGLRMVLLNTPPDRYELKTGVYRGGAYIYMGGDAGLDQDFAGSVLTSGQFVFAEKDNLTKWRVDANVGFNWRVTPYYREVG